VVAVLNGDVHSAFDLRKAHTYRLDAFSSGDAGLVGVMEEHRLTRWRDWPEGEALGVHGLPVEEEAWPRVEIVTSHVGTDGALVRALCELGTQGLVVAATGNGTVHRTLEAALVEAEDQGLIVWRSSRCGNGCVLERADDVLPSAGELTPVQARVELILQLLVPPQTPG
jgi:L-asparaginase